MPSLEHGTVIVVNTYPAVAISGRPGSFISDPTGKIWPDFLHPDATRSPRPSIYSEADLLAAVFRFDDTVDTQANGGINSEMPAWMFNSREKGRPPHLRVSFPRQDLGAT